MKRLVACAISLVAATALAIGSARAAPDSEAAFVLDRTYSCAIALHGGIYQLENRAHPGARASGSWTKLAYAGLRAGVFSGGTGNLLAWVSAGKVGVTGDMVLRAPGRRSLTPVPRSGAAADSNSNQYTPGGLPL